jgi:hypothetical protein
VRDAVLTLLAGDSILQASPYELTVDNIHTGYGLAGSRITPNISDTGYFIILRWEEMIPGPGMRRVLSVWMHKDMSKGVDFVPITRALLRIRDLMTSTFHRNGGDGEKMTMAEFTGIGADQVDESYGTITQYAAFRVLGGISGAG